jgi:hypothetical protein
MFHVPSSPLARIRGSYQALTTAAALILTSFVKVLFCEFFCSNAQVEEQGAKLIRKSIFFREACVNELLLQSSVKPQKEFQRDCPNKILSLSLFTSFNYF